MHKQKLKSNVQEASFDLGKLAALELNVISEDEAAENNSFEVQSGEYFSVIAGSFREKSNALKKLDILKANGFDDASLAKQSSDGLIRVAYGRFKSKSEAIRLYYFILNTLEEEAWYLAE